MKKLNAIILMFVAVLVLLAGCSKETPPKEAVQAALLETMELESYSFNTKLNVEELSLPSALLEEGGAEAAMILSLIQNADVTISGNYQAKPAQMEMNLDIVLKGDMSFSLSIPMIMKENKLWLQIPQIPMLPIPELTGKWLEIDAEELSKMQGMEVPSFDIEGQRSMLQDLMGIVLKHFDEEQYYSELKESDVAALPEGMKPERIIKFAVNQANWENTVNTLYQDVAPELIDRLLQNEQYRQSLQLTTEQLEQAKEELQASSDEIQEQLSIFNESVDVNELSLLGVISDGYMAYQEVVLDLGIKQEGETGALKLVVQSEYANVNKSVTFEYEVPTEVITIDEISALFMSGMGLGGL